MVGLIRAGVLLAAAFSSLSSLASASVPTTTVSIDTRYEEPPPLHPFLQAYLNGTLDDPRIAPLGVAHDDSDPELTCFNQCYGINRATSVQSINWFCGLYGHDQVFLGPRMLNGVYYHNPSLHVGPQWQWYEEAWILMHMGVPDNEICSENVAMTFEACASNLLDCVDGCDTSTPDGKQGGYVNWGCLYYEWQPNPHCYPNCLTGTPWSDTDPSSMHCVPNPPNADPPRKRDILDIHSTSDAHAADTVKSNAKKDTPNYGGTIVGSNEAELPSDARAVEVSPSADDASTADCFNQCFGIQRAHAVDAINWFCGWTNNFAFLTVENYVTGTWSYPPDMPVVTTGTTAYEEGQISLSVTAPNGCEEVTIMPSDICEGNMLGTVDWCNTDGQDGKQGGNIYTGCLKYTLQPNPRCWPECMSEPLSDIGTAECALP